MDLKESDFLTLVYHKASKSHQNSMVLAQKQKHRSMDRIENPEINAYTYGQLTYDKGGEKIQWRKDNLFNNWCWENCTAACKCKHFLPYTTAISSQIHFLEC